MIKKQGLSLLLAALMVFSLSGCGQEVQETNSGKSIELLEPVNVASNVEKVAYRNIYDCKVYSAIAYPTITEYSFSNWTTTDGKGAFLGDEVKKGTVLLYGSTEQLDEQIEAMEERIADMDESMVEALQNLNDSIAEPIEEEKRLKDIVDGFEKKKPDELIPASELEDEESVSDSDAGEDADKDTDGDRLVPNPEYESWKAEADVWIGKYRITAHNTDMQEEAYRQRKELYDLERAYLVEQLQSLKDSRSEYILRADGTGEVVAKKQVVDDYGYNASYSVGEDTPVVAVGDMEKLVLKSDYINKGEMAKADDYYALIDGVRYEVEYHPIATDEYKKLTENGGKAYSTFTFKGDYSSVNVGDLAVICVFKERNENVLSIPKDAIHKDSTGNFVYIIKDGESIVNPIKTGITDGVYTEVVSGLNEGDEIMIENARTFSGKTAEVTYGSFSTSFENWGELSGATETWVENPVEYGTTYFQELKVNWYQHVEKGDVIATIRVVRDEISLQRNTQKLQRAEERLADLKAAGEEENKKSIEAKEKEIAELKELIADMEADGRLTEIKAPISGLIIRLNNLEAETIINNGTVIATIADESTFRISVENSNQLLNYGNEVTVSYQTYDGLSKSCEGKVVYAGMAGLSKELQSGNVMIKVPQELLPELVVARTDNSDWFNPKRYKITATVRTMENVLVVPRSAVTEINGCTYVNVMDEQGNVTTRSFVAGGYNNTNYWIIDGLSEGMVVCLK